MPGPLLPLNGATLAVLAVPTILKTLVRHFRHKDKVLEERCATKSLFRPSSRS